MWASDLVVLALTLTPSARNFVIGLIITLIVCGIAGKDPGDEDPIDPTEFDHDGWNRW